MRTKENYFAPWSTNEEIRFIKTLSSEKLKGYKQAFLLRGEWGAMHSKTIEAFLKIWKRRVK